VPKTARVMPVPIRSVDVPAMLAAANQWTMST
jgi:hypothetical protein